MWRKKECRWDRECFGLQDIAKKIFAEVNAGSFGAKINNQGIILFQEVDLSLGPSCGKGAALCPDVAPMKAHPALVQVSIAGRECHG